MEGEVVGDKGKARSTAGPATDRTATNGEEAMWAVILTKELWRKGIWYVFSHMNPSSMWSNKINDLGRMQSQYLSLHSGVSTPYQKCKVHPSIFSWVVMRKKKIVTMRRRMFVYSLYLDS